MDVDVGGTPEPENMGADDMARDGESDLVVQQLERGLPRWEGFGDFGWMKEKEGSEERWLELVLAIKGHKDAVCVLLPSLYRLKQLNVALAAIAMQQPSRLYRRKQTYPTCPLAYVVTCVTNLCIYNWSCIVPSFVETGRGRESFDLVTLLLLIQA